MKWINQAIILDMLSLHHEPITPFLLPQEVGLILKNFEDWEHFLAPPTLKPRLGTIISLTTHVSIHPSTGHTKKDLPHCPNINLPPSCKEQKPLKMCFLHEPTCWLKPFKSSISETNSAYPAREEIKEKSQGRDTFDFSMSPAGFFLFLQFRQSLENSNFPTPPIHERSFFFFSFSPLHQKGLKQAWAN